MTEDSFDEWTPEERAQLGDVGRHRSPRSELKARTVRALRQRALLDALELRRPRRQLAFGLAAAIVVFAAGMLAGYSVGLRRQAESRDSITGAGGAGPAREVARVDSPSTQSAVAGGRYIVWF